MSTLNEMATNTNGGEPVSWLNTLKVGDEVAICYRGEYSLCRVERETRTQLVIGGLKFSKATGDQIGADTWSRRYLACVTQEMRDALERRKLLNNLNAKDLWKVFDLDQLRAIWELLCRLKSQGDGTVTQVTDGAVKGADNTGHD